MDAFIQILLFLNNVNSQTNADFQKSSQTYSLAHKTYLKCSKHIILQIQQYFLKISFPLFSINHIQLMKRLQQLYNMQTNKERLQKLQQTIISQLTQGHPQPLLNESIYHELKSKLIFYQDPPPSNLYPYLHKWYMVMQQKIKHSLLDKQKPCLVKENQEDEPKLYSQDLKLKNIKLKPITQDLTDLIKKFSDDFCDKYKNISQQDYGTKIKLLFSQQYDIHQKFELMLYRSSKIYYNQKKIYTKDLQQLLSNTRQSIVKKINSQKVIIDYTLLQGLRLWIKSQFIGQFQSNLNFQRHILENFIIDLTPQQKNYTNYFELPMNKQYQRIIVIQDKKYQKTIRMVLSRYKNYKSIQIISKKQYQANKDVIYAAFSIYNHNQFFSCLQIQHVATQSRLPNDQLASIKVALGRMKFNKKGADLYQLDKKCDFYINNILKNPPIGQQHNKIMYDKKQWNINPNKAKGITITRAPIAAGNNASVKGMIGVGAEDISKIYNLTKQSKTPDYLWKYQWTHIVATTLGGRYEWSNGFIGPSFFNRVMQRYQQWLVSINNEDSFSQYNLNQIRYNISLTHPTFDSGTRDGIFTFGLFAETLNMEIIADFILFSSEITLIRHQFKPFLKIYPMRVQRQLFQQCVKQLCQVQKSRRKFQNNSQLHTNIIQDDGSSNQCYQYLRRSFFSEVRNYFKQRIKEQILTIANNLSFKVKVISSQDNQNNYQDDSYSVQILQLQSQLLQKLCGQNLLSSSLTETLKIDEISFNVNSSICGFFVNLKSKPFDLPQAIASMVNIVFNFDKPTLVFQGSLHFRDNFLLEPQTPDYFSIKANLEESNKSQKSIVDLNYSFENLNLSLGFRHKQQGGYDVDWSIGCLANIYKLAKDPIKLSAIFRHNQGQNELQAKITEPISTLMGIDWLSVKQMELKINFTLQEITLWFAFDISTIRLQMKAFYGSKMISMKCIIEDLKINDILAIINKIIGTQLSVGLDLNFQKISLEIIVDRVKKDNIFNFELQFKIGSTTFQGSLHHEKNELQLIASADTVAFDILGEKITLTQPKLSLITNETFDELKYNGTLDYRSKSSQGLSATITTILGVQKVKKANQNNYHLQAEIKLDLEPALNKILEYLAAIDTIKLVYKSQNYIPIKIDQSGKYLSITTKKFIILKEKISLQIKFDFQKLILSASVLFDYDKNDKTSYFLLAKVGISVALKAVQIKLQVDFVSPRLNNAYFTGALLFGPGYVGGELTMAGVVDINNYIQFGYPQGSGQKTILKLAYNNEAVDFQISAAIRIYDFYGAGHIRIVADVLTYLQVTVENLDFVKIVSSMINAIRSEDKSNTKQIMKFSQEEAKQVKLFVIQKLYFKYDILNLNIEAQLNATLFDNQYQLTASVNTKGISFFANIQKPIGIVDLISLSSATDPAKGPLLNIQLNQKQFKININCKIQFGPISSATIINIDSSHLSGQIDIHLFAIDISAGLTIDNQKKIYEFSVQLKEHLISIDNFVKKIVDQGQNKFQFQKNPQTRKNELLRQTRLKRNIFASQYRQGLYNSKKSYAYKKDCMTSLFGQKRKNLFKEIRAKNKKRITQIQQEIRMRQIQMMEINNYKEYHKNQNKTFTLQHNQYLTQGENKLLSIQKNINRLKMQKKQLQTVDSRTIQQLLNVNKAKFKNLKGFWDDFTSWVQSAYSALKQIIQDVIDLLPHVTKFKIGASLKPAGQSFEFAAYCRFTFKVLTVTKDVNLQWDGHFDQQIIQQKAITEMTLFSLTFVRSVYLIPRPLIERANLKNLEDIYLALDKGTLQGLNITYNPSLKKNVQKPIQIPYLSIGTPELFDLYKNQSESQYCFCLSKTLDFHNQFTNTQMKMTKYFCNRESDQDSPASLLLGKSKKEDLIKAGFTLNGSIPLLQIDNKLLILFKISSLQIGDLQYKRYELMPGQRFTMIQNKNGQFQPFIMQDQNLKAKSGFFSWFLLLLPISPIFFAVQFIKQKFLNKQSREQKFDSLWKQLEAFPKPKKDELPI